MDIRVNLKIFLFVAIFYVTGQINIYGIFMCFAILHELGHLLAGIIMGFKPKALHIMPLGLCVSFRVFPKDINNKILKGNIMTMKKILIALAGPITNIVLAIAFYFSNTNILGISNTQIIYANILIAIFNLIPIYPLDGGRVFKNLCKLFFGIKKSVIYTNMISNATIVLLTMISSIAIYYYKNLSILFIIGYLWILVIMENRKYNMKIHMYKIIENNPTNKDNIEIQEDRTIKLS